MIQQCDLFTDLYVSPNGRLAHLIPSLQMYRSIPLTLGGRLLHASSFTGSERMEVRRVKNADITGVLAQDFSFLSLHETSGRIRLGFKVEWRIADCIKVSSLF